MNCTIDVLIESETWPARAGESDRLSGSDIVLSGPTEEQSREQSQKVGEGEEVVHCAHE